MDLPKPLAGPEYGWLVIAAGGLALIGAATGATSRGLRKRLGKNAPIALIIVLQVALGILLLVGGWAYVFQSSFLLVLAGIPAVLVGFALTALLLPPRRR
jgi:hypothetical protein